jgi:pimeloyl-ACP methyl ester carboxylesterase
MNRFTTKEGIGFSYAQDYFGPPWQEAEAEVVVLVHGTGESSRAWYAWVPPLSATYRVIRPDMPGYGESRIAKDVPYSWSTERQAADLRQLVDSLGLKPFHLVGAKFGGSVVVQFASRYPELVKTLTVVGGPVQVKGQKSGVDVPSFAARIDADIRRWAEESMGKRLGSGVSEAHRTWWIELMAGSDPRATREAADETAKLDLFEKLKQVKAPVLFITTDGNQLVLLDGYRAWAEKLPGAVLKVLSGDDYHPASVHPEECVAAVLKHFAG